MGVLADALADGTLTREERHAIKVAAFLHITDLIGRTFNPRPGVFITVTDAGRTGRALRLAFRVVVNGIERDLSTANPFYFVNPPILVPDPQGDIVRTWTDRFGVEHTERYSENLLQALRQMAIDALKGALL
jgi:hypothetical protein